LTQTASTMTQRRVAIVTGGSRGIGRAIAEALGGLGYGVAINYHSNSEAAAQAVSAVEAAGGAGLTLQADIGSADDRRRLVDQTIDQLGPIDLLVNNAGVAPKVRADLLEMSEDSFDYVIGTNLKGPMMLSQLVANRMLAQHDQPEPRDRAIINVGSISAYAASVNRGEYCVAKAGVGMLTKLFAERLAPHGINVYEIRPGIIETDMTAGVKEKYDKLILEDGLTPTRRWGRPSDVAAAVAAVAEGRFPFSTGQIFDVDGGFHLHRL